MVMTWNVFESCMGLCFFCPDFFTSFPLSFFPSFLHYSSILVLLISDRSYPVSVKTLHKIYQSHGITSINQNQIRETNLRFAGLVGINSDKSIA